MNDNAPILEAVPDISVVAGSSKRSIATVCVFFREIKIKFRFHGKSLMTNKKLNFKIHLFIFS